jgi:hypothetical protein
MDPFFAFIVQNGEAIGFAVFGIFAIWLVLTDRLMTRSRFDKQMDQLRAGDATQVAMYKEIDEERKEALNKANTRLDEQAIQIRELAEGQETFVHFIDSMRYASNLQRKEVLNHGSLLAQEE